jgi:signal transduction histidine kinase
MTPALRILLLEDNADDVRLLRLYLADAEDFQCELDAVSTLEKGLAALGAREYEAILLDMHLPDAQGLEGLAALRTLAEETPILLLTGFADIDTAVQAVRRGAQDYLVKGKVDGEILSRAIRYAIERNRAEQQIKQLSRRVLEIQEEERARISREIHDGLGQDLFALKLLVQTSFERLEHPDPVTVQNRSLILDSIKRLIEHARHLARNLSPVFMETAGLPAAILRLAETFEMGGSLNVTANVEALDGFFPNNWDINLYRIVHEALLNVVRHSGASEVDIAAKRTGDLLTLRIHDNGKGFMVDEIMNSMKGLGLIIMDERARLLSGKLEIRSVPGNGSEVYVEIKRSERSE